MLCTTPEIKIELLLPIWKIYHRFLPSDSWSREGDGLEEDFLKAIAKILIELKTIQKTIHPILSLRYLVMHHCCPLLGHRRWRSSPLKNALDDGQTLVDFGLEALLVLLFKTNRIIWKIFGSYDSQMNQSWIDTRENGSNCYTLVVLFSVTYLINEMVLLPYLKNVIYPTTLINLWPQKTTVFIVWVHDVSQNNFSQQKKNVRLHKCAAKSRFVCVET